MYEPLDPSRREIRLLQLVEESETGIICCRLHTVSLDDIGLKFAALSYVWGDESITRDVIVNGHRRAVTTNLESALRNFSRNFRENSGHATRRFNLAQRMAEEPNGLTGLRRCLATEDCDLHHESDIDDGSGPEDEDDKDGPEGEDDMDGGDRARNSIVMMRILSAYQRVRVGGGDLLIWIDALCINQDDLVEKSYQISMMRDIYAKADCVFSWLGPSDDRKIDLALRTIRSLAVLLHSGDYWKLQLPQDRPEPCKVQYLYPPINDDCKLEAIQNFAMSEYFQRIWIFQELWATDNAIFLCGDEYLPMRALGYYHVWATSLFWNTINNMDESSVPRLSVPTISPITQVFMAKGGWEGVKTCGFLEIARRWHCKDPRDKVFALLGLFQMGIAPDYTMSVANVYANWATNSHQIIPLGELLSYSGIGLSPRTLECHNLASWQPDLTILGEQLRDGEVVGLYRDLDAEVPDRFEPTVSQTRCFTCFGIKVAVVREAASFTFKETISRTIGRDLRKRRSDLSALKYLLDNRRRLWSQGYHTKGSQLWMFVQTLNEWMDSGSGPPIPDLTPEILSAFSLRNVFKTARKQMSVLREDDLDKFDVDELNFLGFKSEEELWDCLIDIPTDFDDRVNLQPDPGLESAPGDPLFEFLLWMRLLLRNKILFHTDGGLLGVGPTGMEMGDMVHLSHGSSLPVLIREVDGKLRHVGVCYISGISEGRRVLMDRDCDVRELNLV